jgi:hypothetical protein
MLSERHCVCQLKPRVQVGIGKGGVTVGKRGVRVGKGGVRVGKGGWRMFSERNEFGRPS